MKVNLVSVLVMAYAHLTVSAVQLLSADQGTRINTKRFSCVKLFKFSNSNTLSMARSKLGSVSSRGCVAVRPRSSPLPVEMIAFAPKYPRVNLSLGASVNRTGEDNFEELQLGEKIHST